MTDRYEVIAPSSLYKGKTYNSWIKEYLNWYFSVDPDMHNSGDVVFLKSVPSGYPPMTQPNTMVGSNTTFMTQPNTMVGSNTTFMTQPNTMVGSNRLDIYIDQAILIPTIVQYFSANEPGETPDTLKSFVRDAADNSDDPPRGAQIIIDRYPISLGGVDIRLFRMETDLFTLFVPDAEIGRSYKDYVEYPPLPPGNWQTVGGGYFFLVKFLEDGTFFISSRAKGKKYRDGTDYYADLFYEIVVHKRSQKPEAAFDFNTSKRTKLILMRVKESFDKGEMNVDEYNIMVREVEKPELLTALEKYIGPNLDYSQVIMEDLEKIKEEALGTKPGHKNKPLLTKTLKDMKEHGEITEEQFEKSKAMIIFDLLEKIEDQMKKGDITEEQFEKIKGLLK